MRTKADIIAEARSWLGTPYRHQGRLKGVAVDCAGVIIGVGKACGCMPTDGSADITGYSREPDPVKMRTALRSLLDPIPLAEIGPACVAWMRGVERPQHLGIVSERNTLIHAVNGKGCEELPIESKEQFRIIAAYRFRGIDD